MGIFDIRMASTIDLRRQILMNTFEILIQLKEKDKYFENQLIVAIENILVNIEYILSLDFSLQL
jgi:hypothetical protein